MAYGIQVYGNGTFNDITTNRMTSNHIKVNKGYFDSIGVGGSSKFEGSGITASSVRSTNKIPITIAFKVNGTASSVTRNWDLKAPVHFDLGDIKVQNYVASNSNSSSSDDSCSCTGFCSSKNDGS